MFCSQCGLQIPEGQTLCDNCRKASPDQSSAVVTATAASSGMTCAFDLGDYFKDFFKDPIQAAGKRADTAHLLLGGIVLFLLAFQSFVFDLISGLEFGYAFGQFFVYLLDLAVIILVLFAFADAFGVQKLDFPGIVSLLGLAYMLPLVANIVSNFTGAVESAMFDGSYFNPISPISYAVGFLVPITLIGVYATRMNNKGNKFKTIAFVLIAFLAGNFVYSLGNTILISIFF
ncbi:MAG TPA: hypothetical protein PKV44_03175 [Bacillota bacterium]|nr:hypothetical protein [Bacillota bacterium]HPE39081.1 hypothetical protein [Bacillota bacterium]